MTDEISVRAPKTSYDEGSAFTITADFRSSDAATSPTTVHYQVVNLSADKTVKDWTSASAASQTTISIAPGDNVCEFGYSISERFRCLVQADRGLSSQFTGHVDWHCRNFRNIS